MGKVFCLVIIGCVAAQGAFASTADRPQRTIPCGEIIQTTRFPYPGNPRRPVLAAVSVPPAYLRAHPTLETPWRYFAKNGMVVKSGTSVTISVPPGWRKRVAITWGNNVHGVFHTIRIAACSRIPKQGYAYAGGFFLRRPSACVPLVFAVDGRRQTVWSASGDAAAEHRLFVGDTKRPARARSPSSRRLTSETTPDLLVTFAHTGPGQLAEAGHQ